MRFIYPAVFHKTEDGKYKAHFPDLECCYAEGDTLEEAVDNANEAASNWISAELMEEDWICLLFLMNPIFPLKMAMLSETSQ